MPTIEEIERQKRIQLAGLFENYVNHEASPAFPKSIMKIVSDLANEYGWSAEWARSVSKNTYVSVYSDGDLWIETRSNVVDDDLRDQFAVNLKKSLPKGTYYTHKPTATAFYTDLFDFDIVFSNATWCNASTPDDSNFKNKPERQRAVKGLKLLSRMDPSLFPRIAGFALESLALHTCRTLKSQGVEFTSGYSLFEACLLQFYITSSESDLVNQIAQSGPVEFNWKLSYETYIAWKNNGAALLACLNEFVSSPSMKADNETFKKVFMLKTYKKSRSIRSDTLNRPIFA